ncbi:MAG: hypothetical protein ACJ76X_00545 [Solirubrobacteraceae bacterium]
MTRRASIAALAALPSLAAATAALGGCSLPGGAPPPPPVAAQSPVAPPPTKLQQAQATHEYPSPPPPPEHVKTAAAQAQQAVAAFATAYINWNAANVSARMQALAAASIGQARSAMALAAAQTAGDYELKRGGVANTGAVEAVAPLPGHRDEYVVVTRERTTATNTTAYQGLRPAWHVAVASVTRLANGGGWVVSRWQPEN